MNKLIRKAGIGIAGLVGLVYTSGCLVTPGTATFATGVGGPIGVAAKVLGDAAAKNTGNEDFNLKTGDGYNGRKNNNTSELSIKYLVTHNGKQYLLTEGQKTSFYTFPEERDLIVSRAQEFKENASESKTK